MNRRRGKENGSRLEGRVNVWDGREGRIGEEERKTAQD